MVDMTQEMLYLMQEYSHFVTCHLSHCHFAALPLVTLFCVAPTSRPSALARTAAASPYVVARFTS